MFPVEKRINYQIIGDDSSPKLVFLHGIMGQGRNWQSIAKKFSKDFQCLVYDQRGHGKSMHPESGFELEDYSKDLYELLTYLDWNEPIYLVGHSMGGRVALYFADKYPEKIKKLVIVDIGASANWDSMEGIVKQLEFVPAPFQSREEARSFMEAQFLEKYPNKMVMEFFYSNLLEVNGRVNWIFSKELIKKTLEFARYKDYWSEFKNLAMPTLYIRGGNSSHLKEAEFTEVLRNNSKIQGWTVEGAGHWLHAEKPMETLRVMDEFFDIAALSKQ